MKPPNPTPRRGRKLPTFAGPGEARDLVINSVGARGDGVSGGVFIPLTLPGERVKAQVTADRGELLEVLEPSAERVSPPCRHFGDCGGCALQHWAEEPYLTWKADLIRQALSRVGLETEILAPFVAPAGDRRRLALHARRLEGGVILGLKARRSWRVTPIDGCQVALPALVMALPALAALAEPFLEHPKSAPTLHVTATLTGLDVDVTGVERRSGGLSGDARMQVAARARAADIARVSLAGEILFQARAPVVRMGEASVALPPGGFVQASAAAERAMADFAIEAAAGASRVVDLYCGAGAFALPLARLAPVRAADFSSEAVAALNAAVGTAPGLKGVAAEARDLDRRPIPAAELNKIDVAVIDPPRAGAAAQHREIARSALPRVVGVSCNPATFARDARILVDGGFRLDKVLPVDQFRWSPHIELVSVFSR